MGTNFPRLFVIKYMQHTWQRMPSNVEIKARLLDRDRAISVARELSGSEGSWLWLCGASIEPAWFVVCVGERLEQEDTFFKVTEGRLKVRN